MTTLKDPIRFASFAEGASHIDDSEVLLFQNSKSSETDDSNNIDDEDLNANENEANLIGNRVTSNRRTNSSNNEANARNTNTTRGGSIEMNNSRLSGRRAQNETRNTSSQNRRRYSLRTTNVTAEISDDEN